MKDKQYETDNSDTSFSLHATTTNADFAQRQKSIFDQLNVLENTRRSTADPAGPSVAMDTDEQVGESPDRTLRRNQRSITKHFRGKESIFKKPQNPIPKNYLSRIPDFKKNPHKWTRYSLEDVRDEDMSDECNTRTALAFLKELRDRKAKSTQEKMERLPDKIVFNKNVASTSVTPKEEQEESWGVSKPTFRSSKLIMPEYVVGQKVKKEKKSRGNKADRGKELKLDHLHDEEEDE
ncbi:hypothetical protein NQ315_001039 [Exocentrus adspersus]|uniref:U5 small nuclear ribonucleoprotein TSSC4 n=1 Tax=Exocentrus adspersus TaxID=1586481 RepID=A0AAV8WEB0_9CUCU|nr:hypothetical protein NQ315_001039 [Exocentrus adspersus]